MRCLIDRKLFISFFLFVSYIIKSNICFQYSSSDTAHMYRKRISLFNRITKNCGFNKINAKNFNRLYSTQQDLCTQHQYQQSDSLFPTNYDPFDKPKTPVFIVQDAMQAHHAINVLESHADHIWACDTEVADIDVKLQGPIGNGKVICISIYGGQDVDFGDGASTLWIENDGESFGTLNIFKDWFENENYKKVWHNYGFDRHVMFNEGIDCKGFAGDTMHMARLWDTSRDKINAGGDGYSLEVLSNTLYPDDHRFTKTSMKDLFGIARLKKNGDLSKIKELPDLRMLQHDLETRDLWIEYSARDAVATWWVRDKLKIELQKMKWKVNDVQLGSLYDFYVQYLCPFGELLTDMERNGIKVDTKGHLKEAEAAARKERDRMEALFLDWASTYCDDVKHINIASTQQMQQLLFGEYEDRELIASEKLFKIDKTEEELEAERNEVLQANPYALMIAADLKNILKERGIKCTGSKLVQMSRLLEYDRKYLELSKLTNDEIIQRFSEFEPLIDKDGESNKDTLIKTMLKLEVLKSYKDISKQKRELRKIEKLLIEQQQELTATAKVNEGVNSDITEDDQHTMMIVNDGNTTFNNNINYVDNIDFNHSLTNEIDTSIINPPINHRVAPKKYREIIIKTIGLVPEDFTPTGVPQVSAGVLQKLAGKNLFGDEKDAVWGRAFEFFGGGEDAKKACRALGALASVGQFDTTITNFLVPLQALVDENSRIHCSLNLNTETGRLSSRKPNLQNQPALEKDQFKIRDAFIAEEGKTLIVADYGQLELRILAHISKCKSMIDAFASGGCFHSRTAVGMYDYIREAVESGKVMLEWDYSKGQPTVPLVKDTYASERRKAKTLNFSIAYGKTVHGLAQDWGITKEEAQETLDAWYRDRPEVKQWQEITQLFARRHAYVTTIMGRWRRLPDASGASGNSGVGHALRAAINTPIQGSAADIVMMAMLKLWRSEVLKSLGWKLLLQIHDEVILEGPIESKDEAMIEVRKCMENPYDEYGLHKLKVFLDVDAKSANSWYKAK